MYDVLRKLYDLFLAAFGGNPATPVLAVSSAGASSGDPLVTAWTYFSTSDARNGLTQTYTERRESDAKTRTVTITRDTATGAILTQSATAWA